MTIATAQRPDLAGILAERGDPMDVVRSTPWLKRLAKIPADAAPPLAMSGPHPRAVGSYGADLEKWAKRELRLTLRWWQRLAIARQLEHDDDGQLVWPEVLETGPRRIGKSTRLRATALWRLANAEKFQETQLAMLVSKDLAVGKEIHRGSWNWAYRRGWNVVKLGGAQEIARAPIRPGVDDNDRWLLRAPEAAYGYDVGYGQIDEAWGVKPEAITDGIEPALLERISPQLHLTSTAHARASSLMRRRLVSALLGAEDVLLLMWGAHPDADVAEESTWRAASPHWSEERRKLIARKYDAAVRGEAEPEFDDPDPTRGWAAQYLNVWPNLLGSGSSSILPKWDDRSSDREPEPAALGIASDLDQVWLSLAASSDGPVPHLGAVVRMRSTDRVRFAEEVRRIQVERDVKVTLDQGGPGAFILRDLEDADVEVTPAGLDDRIQADGDLEKAVESGEVTHGDHPDLNDAVAAASWRKIAERGRVFGRKSGDSSMLEAASLARHVAMDGETYDLLDSIY